MTSSAAAGVLDHSDFASALVRALMTTTATAVPSRTLFIFTTRVETREEEPKEINQT